MHSLFINTATKLVQVSIWKEDQCLKTDEWESQFDEAEKLLPAIQSLLKDLALSKTDISQLICCTGPGGFTSVRIGVSAINAWSYAAQVPVATVSVFDLYPQDSVILINANANETWVKLPGQKPAFVIRSDLKLPDSFSYSGEIRDDWGNHLNSFGGTQVKATPSLSDISTLEFKKQIVEPWYYKDPNITWSSKNKSS
jgi:hypothetical protein